MEQPHVTQVEPTPRKRPFPFVRVSAALAIVALAGVVIVNKVRPSADEESDTPSE